MVQIFGSLQNLSFHTDPAPSLIGSTSGFSLSIWFSHISQENLKPGSMHAELARRRRAPHPEEERLELLHMLLHIPDRKQPA